MDRRKLLIGLLLSALAGLPGQAADARRRRQPRRTVTADRPSRSTRRYRAYDAPSGQGTGAAYYPNCAAARAAGAAPVRVGEPGYSRRLDRDGDGVGCE